jgi:hypothetical protein
MDRRELGEGYRIAGGNCQRQSAGPAEESGRDRHRSMVDRQPFLFR